MRASQLLSGEKEMENYKKIYADAMSQSNTNRKDLKSDLVRILNFDVSEFEKVIQNIIGASCESKVAIPLGEKPKEVSLGLLWNAGYFGNGSRLRASLTRAYDVVAQMKKDFFNQKLQEVLDKLRAPKLTWEELNKLQESFYDILTFSPDSVGSLADKLNMLKDFILYKQAELFFNTFISGCTLIPATHMIKTALCVFMQGDTTLMGNLSAMDKIRLLNKDIFSQDKEAVVEHKEQSEWERVELFVQKKNDDIYTKLRVMQFLRDLYIAYQEKIKQYGETVELFSPMISKLIDDVYGFSATLKEMQNYQLPSTAKEFCEAVAKVDSAKSLGH